MSKNKVLDMPLDVEKLLASTEKLSDEDFGRYVRLVCLQWVKGALPNDIIEACQQACLDFGAGLSLSADVAAFFTADSGELADPWVAELREARYALAQKRRENGKKGGRKPGPEPYTEEFLEFWKEYPRTQSKRKAFVAWQNLGLGDMKDEVLAGLQRCKASKDWQSREARHLPYASTWLNGEGWDDIPDQTVKDTSGKASLNSLDPLILSKLFRDVQRDEPQVMHQPGNADTERAMFRLAQSRGLI